MWNANILVECSEFISYSDNLYVTSISLKKDIIFGEFTAESQPKDTTAVI